MHEIQKPLEQKLLPPNLFILPVIGNPVFPGLFTPLMLSDEEDIELIEQVERHGGYFGLLLTKDAQPDDNKPLTPDDMYRVGTVAKVVKKINLPEGGISVFVSTIRRFTVNQFFPSSPYMIAKVDYLDDIEPEDENEEIKAWTGLLVSEMKKLTRNNQLFSEEMKLNMVNIDHPGKLADFIAGVLNIDRVKQQNVLETLSVKHRIEMVLVFIKDEQHIVDMQKKIQFRVNQKVEKNQRDYFLREELKTIQQELGMVSNPKTQLIEKFKKLFNELPLPEEVQTTVKNELSRIEQLDPNSPEYSVIRTYLETIGSLPWKEPEKDNFSISSAKRILERDHYGMKEVKERVLEFLAVRKKKGDTKGAIICLVGPPGVGKTSVGISIAKALKKKYFRFSVGGMRDESEIKGHRRTYIGAMPGKIIRGLKITETKNPVFLIDEIDKMGVSYQGDPASALLEVLDPEQNSTFRDNYLDIPFDVSHVLFICTANSLDTIPAPLLDRMEIIRMSGYTENEKLEIGKKYLVPKSLKKHGLDKSEIRYPAATLRKIAQEYAREAGVRHFEKSIDKINRKIAYKLETEEDVELPIRIKDKELETYLGQPLFPADEIVKAEQPGTAVGLAWTSMGGDVLLIEAQKVPGKGEMKLTGQLGEVMQESASIALTWIKSHAEERNIDSAWFAANSIHLHVPEGATPKDGPSAGITMTCALYSLITGQVITPSLAMTGELSLTGKVMPIGGLKEKILAAKRNHIKTILYPALNQRDLDKLTDEVKKGVTFHPVKRIGEVLEYAFPNDKKRKKEVIAKPQHPEYRELADRLAEALSRSFHD